MDMLQRLQSGRLRVFEGQPDWFEEYRLYHRKDGRIVPERDDLLSATRYALMGLRFATTGQGGTSAAGAAAADNPTTTTAGFNPLDW